MLKIWSKKFNFFALQACSLLNLKILIAYRLQTYNLNIDIILKKKMLNAELTKVNSTCLDLRDKYEKEKLKTIDLSSKLQVQEDAKTFFQTLHSQSVAYQKETAAAISSKYKSSVENSLVSQQNSHGSLEGNEADVYEHVSRLVHEYKENAEQAKSQMIDAHQKEVKGLTKLLNDKEDYIEDLNIEMQSMKNQLNEFKASQEENLHLKEKVSKLSEKNLKLMEEKHDTVQEMNEILHINTELQHDISASKVILDKLSFFYLINNKLQL